MINHIKVLFVEDIPSDAELAVRELKKGGFSFEHIRVDTQVGFIKTLNDFRPDIIISDYSMPSYNGMQALKDAKEFDPLIPFILFTGAVNEQIAVECIKAGATDYIIKEHLTRLPFAINEALEQYKTQSEKKAAEILLKESEEKIQSIFRAAPVGIGLVVSRVITEVNDTFCKMTGYSRKELIGKHSEMLYPSKEISDSVVKEKYDHIDKKGTRSLETLFKCKDGSIINVRMSSTPLVKNDLTKGITFTVLDITESKKTEKALQISEDIFSHFMQNSPIYVFFKDAQIRSLRLSRNYEKMLGRTMEELLGKSMDELFPSDLATKMVADDIRILNEAKQIEVKEELNGRFYNTIKFPIIIENEPTYLAGYTIDITEQKMAEDALMESEKRYRSLFEKSMNAIFLVDSKTGKYLNANKAGELLTGRSLEELKKLTTKDISPSGAIDRLQRIKGIVNNENFGEVRYIRPDGSEREAILSAIPIDENLIYGIAIDVTDHKKAGEDLQSSLSLLNASLESTADGILIVDGKGNIIKWNQKFARMWRLPEKILATLDDNLTLNHILDQLTDPENFLATVRELYSNPDISSFDKLEFKDGRIFERYSQPQKIENIVVGRVWSFRDVTQRSIMEAATISSEKRYRELFHNNPVPTYIYEESTLKIIEVNESAVKNYGYSREEFASMTLKDIRLTDDFTTLQKCIKSLDKDTFSTYLVKHRKKDGTIFPVEITTHLLSEGNEEKVRLAMATDITERINAVEQMKLSKEKAEASDKLKTSFLNNISHEVRTPLNGILGFAEIMSQEDLPEEFKIESLSMLHESSDRLLNTITNYMDISLLTSGNMIIHKKDFNPAQSLKKLFNNSKRKCSDRKLELFLNIPDEADFQLVNSDPELFQKVLSHLLNNAIKFTQNGSINFGYRAHEDELEFFVKDTGIGIGQESIDTVFGHFIKEDRGPYLLTEGSGLGLSISKGLVELMGGKICVDSEVNKGSTFSFSLPKIKDVKPTGCDEQETKQLKITKSNTILVAEDDDNNFYYLEAVLKQNTSTKIIHVSTGKQAVEMYMQNPDISLILMDIKMPLMDGFEATRLIKAINRNIPVIAITAFAMSGDEARILDAGFDYFISKPFDKKFLLSKILEYISL